MKWYNWRSLKRSSPEQEQEFAEKLQAEGVTFKEKLVMLLSAYITILLPCILILVVMCLLAALFFRAL